MGNVDHDLHSIPGMGLRSTELQRVNQQRTERKPRVATWAQQVSENIGLFLKYFHFLFEATGGRREDGRGQALEKHLEGHTLCCGDFLQPSPAPPGDRAPGAATAAWKSEGARQESNHFIISSQTTP